MTAPAATSDAVRTSELRRFGGGCEVGRSAAARHARLVAAMAQTMLGHALLGRRSLKLGGGGAELLPAVGGQRD